MIHQEKILFLPLRSFLFLVAALFAVATFVLVTSFTSAQTAANITPSSAISLDEDGNTGSLEPGEQHWFTFAPTGSNVEQTLTLTFNPGNSTTANFIGLTAFEEDQVSFFSDDDTNNMVTFGVSQASADSDGTEAGTIVWVATVSKPVSYYVQVLNDSDFTVEYTLVGSAVSDDTAVEEEPAETVEEETSDVEATAGSLVMVGTDPGNAEEFTFDQTGRGTVAPNSTHWYTFTYPDDRQSPFQDLDFSMFFTPDDGNRRHNVNFQLYEYSEFYKWQRGDIDQLNHFGAGMLVSRDGDDLTGERSWRGKVNKGDKYLLSISNGNDIPMDFWLFDENIINPILGPLPAPNPEPAFVQGEAPHTAIPLDTGVNKGSLAPDEESWYAFRVTDPNDNEMFEEMALTMITTPDDGNRIRHMVFDVFTAQGVLAWSSGDNSRINNMGAGSVVYRDDNDQTGERFWKGWVVDNDLYYVQVRNGTKVNMDYWLFTDDIYGAELGDEPQPIAEITADPGRAPDTATTLSVTTEAVNTGQLQPGKEQWYTFSKAETGATGRVESTFTMFFTPDDGNRIRKINFELFEANQLRDWSPDNKLGITGFGQGSVVNRDGGITTGELLWKGHTFAEDTYYMRVINLSDTLIDYTIYPDDITNTELGK